MAQVQCESVLIDDNFVKIAFRNEISDQEVCQVVHSPSADYCGLCVAQVQCIAVLIDDNFGRLPFRTRSRTRKFARSSTAQVRIVADYVWP